MKQSVALPCLLLALLVLVPISGIWSLSQHADDSRPVASCAVGKRPTPYDAMNELFSCLVQTHLENTELFRRTSRINFHGIAGNGVTQPPLLTGVYSKREVLSSGESYQRYYDVSSIFTIELGRNEVRGPEELAKLNVYLNFLEKSPFIRDTYETLKANQAIPESVTYVQFVRGTLYDLWFKQYGRTAKAHEQGLMESSGFGHVFVGEVKTNEVTGFHNWLQLLASEEAGTFQYKGYVRIVTSSVLIGGIQFSWHSRSKPLASVMFGVPPEFELALYSACFVVNPGRKTSLTVRGKSVAVQTYYVDHQRDSIASAYPVV